MLDPTQSVISRKRKKYKFALFHNSPLCFEFEEWPRNSPVDVLEMGAGTGLFSVDMAMKSPKRQFVAIDVKADRLQTGARAASEAKLQNIRFLRARADQLEVVVKPYTLSEIWLTFPDPFPKTRSAKHRLTHPHFLKLYKRWLAKDGVLYVKTDARGLFDWSLEQLVAEGWIIKELSFDLHNSQLKPRYKHMTTYERRYVAEGKAINFAAAAPPLF